MRWAAVQGAEGTYEVSDEGEVRSLDRTVVAINGLGRTLRYKGRTVKPHDKGHGYAHVKINGKNESVHSLVMLAFGPPKPHPNVVVNHIDGVKLNNRIGNLEWATVRRNNIHARETGLNRSHGERCIFTSFGDDKIDAVRLLWPTCRFTQEELAKLFGMTAKYVGVIVRMEKRKRPT